MKKFLSCVLALALVFSLMSMTVFAGDELHPNLQDPSSNTVAGDTPYQVVGTQGDKAGTSTSHNDGVTSFVEKGVTGDLNVSFVYETEEDVEGGGTTTVERNILEHRYAIDIVYKDLLLDLGQLTTTTIVKEGDVTEEITVKFVWDVNKHAYVMVNTETNEIVNDGDTNTEDTVTAADEVVLADAFYIVNHSDKDIDYTAHIAVSDYEAVLNLGIDTANARDLATTTIARCTVDASGVSSGAINNDGATAHDIIATPDVDWATTISSLAASAQAKVKVGTIEIKVVPTDRADAVAPNA